MIKLEKVSDVFELVSRSTSWAPKKITFDLSEDGTFYHTKIYVDMIDKNNNTTSEACIECKSKLPSVVGDFRLVYDHEDRDAEIFTMTLPDE